MSDTSDIPVVGNQPNATCVCFSQDGGRELLRKEVGKFAAASSISVSEKLLALDGPWPVPVLFNQSSEGNWSVDLTTGAPNAIFGKPCNMSDRGIISGFS